MPSPDLMTNAARCTAVRTAALSKTGMPSLRAIFASSGSANTASSGLSRPGFLNPAQKLSKSIVSSAPMPASAADAFAENIPSRAAAL